MQKDGCGKSLLHARQDPTELKLSESRSSRHRLFCKLRVWFPARRGRAPLIGKANRLMSPGPTIIQITNLNLSGHGKYVTEEQGRTRSRFYICIMSSRLLNPASRISSYRLDDGSLEG